MNNEEKRDIMARSRAIMNQIGVVVAVITEIPIESQTPETDSLILREVCEADIIAHAMKLEQERDKYAGLLCEAMDWIYMLDDQDQRPSDARTEMIRAFEALELTPANGSC